MSTPSLAAVEDPAKQALSVLSIAILMLSGAVLWLLAALFIRYVGPRGAFSGWWLGLTYAGTALLTIRTNITCRRLAGLPPGQTLTAVAIASATALFLDAIAFAWPDRIYGTNPVVLLGGAVWLLFAIGVALALALVTTHRARSAA